MPDSGTALPTKPDPTCAVDVDDYLGLLRRLRAWSGGPSLAVLARRSGVPGSTLHDALHPRRTTLPALEVVRRLVHALGVAQLELTGWTHRWRELQAGTVATPPVPAQTAGVPRQLPREASRFVGRAVEDKLFAEFGGTGIVVVTGQPGIGKSALAVRWAHRAAARFPGGQLYLDLRGFSSEPPISPARALTALLRSLGVPPEDIPAGTDDMAAHLRTVLADRRVLLFLDDAAGPTQVRPLLPPGSDCLTLVTSRLSLDGLVARDGANAITLHPLPVGDAVDALAEILGPERTAREPSAVMELAEVCGRVPLALRIAGATLAARPDQSIDDYVREVRGDVLAAFSIPGDDEAAVSAAFTISYRRLPARAQRVLRRLSLISGDFGVPTAAALTGGSQADLAALTSANLLERSGRHRHRLHDLVRLCARQQLAADDDVDEARLRLLDWTLRSVITAVERLRPQVVRLPDGPLRSQPAAATFPDVPAARAWLDAERTHLIELIIEAAPTDLGEYAWRLADALRGYFWLRVPRADWTEAADAGLAAATTAGDEQAVAAMHHCLGDAMWNADDYAAAIAGFTRSLQACRAAGDRQREVAVLINLGLVNHEASRLPNAAEALRAAVRVCRQLSDPRREADVLGRLGALATDLGRLDEAERSLRRAIRGQRQHGTRYRYAGIIGNLGVVLRHRGRLAEAAGCLTEAVEIYREVGNRLGEAGMLEELAITELDRDRPEEAVRLAENARQLAEEAGERRTAIDAEITLATVETRRGLGEPQRRLTRCLRTARSEGHRYTEIRALLAYADIANRVGRHRAAVKVAKRAAALSGTTGYVLLAAQALSKIAEAWRTAGDLPAATVTAQAAAAAHGRCGQRLWQARACILLADVLAAQDRPDEARAARMRARAALDDTDRTWPQLRPAT